MRAVGVDALSCLLPLPLFDFLYCCFSLLLRKLGLSRPELLSVIRSLWRSTVEKVRLLQADRQENPMELEMLKCVWACNNVPSYCSGQFPSLFSLLAGLDEFGKGRSSLDVVVFKPVAFLVFPGAALWEQP